MATTNYDINYDDERFGQVESDKQQALTELENTYGGMIGESDKYYQAQIDASKQWADKQTQLQNEKIDFAIQELGLYLTTHRDDTEALNLFRAYVKLAKEGREKYEESYGPLCKTTLVGSGFAWIDNPWPWDLGGND